MLKPAFDAQRDGSEFALVADVGGTNARFALAPLDSQGAIIEQRSLRVRDYPSLADAANAYLTEVAPDNRPTAGMVAVAAPSVSDEIRMTNSDWNFSVSEARAQLGFDELQVINDFAANGWAVLDVAPAELLQVGEKALAPDRVGSFAALGPGTGLGVGAVMRDSDGQVRVVETEGGHVDFAPVSEEEDAILIALRKRFGRVSYERLICGAGLVNLFQVVTGNDRAIAPEEITTRALAGDAEAQLAVDHFCNILGSFAGNVALMHGAWNGIFLSGCMLRSMADTLLNGKFRSRFETKGRFSNTVAQIPTLLVLDPMLGLRGSAAALRARING